MRLASDAILMFGGPFQAAPIGLASAMSTFALLYIWRLTIFSLLIWLSWLCRGRGPRRRRPFDRDEAIDRRRQRACGVVGFERVSPPLSRYSGPAGQHDQVAGASGKLVPDHAH